MYPVYVCASTNGANDSYRYIERDLFTNTCKNTMGMDNISYQPTRGVEFPEGTGMRNVSVNNNKLCTCPISSLPSSEHTNNSLLDKGSMNESPIEYFLVEQLKSLSPSSSLREGIICDNRLPRHSNTFDNDIPVCHHDYRADTTPCDCIPSHVQLEASMHLNVPLSSEKRSVSTQIQGDLLSAAFHTDGSRYFTTSTIPMGGGYSIKVKYEPTLEDKELYKE